MIKILEDLLIEATTNPNVPANLVAGLRKAVDTARAACGLLPPPFDSQEEAQRPAGLATEWRGHPGLSDWRPTASAPRASAIDEMAEQMKRWAAPALAVQEGGSHYKDMKIQPVEYIHANGLGYFEGNVVKYVSRWRAKGGLQDLKKARHYLDLLIELEGGIK